MARPEHRTVRMAGIGLRAQKGGAVLVCVTVAEGEPRVVFSTTLGTCIDGDRLSLEPYRLAYEMARGADGRAGAEAVAAVAEGRRRQDQAAANGLRGVVGQLAQAGCTPAVAALLVNRAGWITDVLEYSLAWAEHVPVAELLAVRDALRFASAQGGIGLEELDEKSLPESSTQVLGLSSTEIDARLKVMGTQAGKPWRKEQKLACLAAWVALTKRR
jgi:hypothetical protein